jgi:5-methylcytosine-specific restriction endonuclease McrA
MFRRVSKIPGRLHKERQTFQFDVCLLGFEGVPRRRMVVLQLQRGLRTATSKPFEVAPNGQRVSLQEILSILCSLYRDRKTGIFDSKDCKLRLLQVQTSSRQEARRTTELVPKALEKLHFDVVTFLGEFGSGIRREHVFELSNGSRVFTTVCLSWVGFSHPEQQGDRVSSYAPSELSRMSIESTLWSDGSDSSRESLQGEPNTETVTNSAEISPSGIATTAAELNCPHVDAFDKKAQAQYLDTKQHDGRDSCPHVDAFDKKAQAQYLDTKQHDGMGSKDMSVMDMAPKEMPAHGRVHDLAPKEANGAREGSKASKEICITRARDAASAQQVPEDNSDSVGIPNGGSSYSLGQRADVTSGKIAGQPRWTGDDSSTKVVAYARALTTMLSLLCANVPPDVERAAGSQQLWHLDLRSTVLGAALEQQDDLAAWLAVAWKKCAHLASTIDALFKEIHGINISLTGGKDSLQIDSGLETASARDIFEHRVFTRGPSQTKDATKLESPSKLADATNVDAYTLHINHSVADVRAEFSVLARWTQQRALANRRLSQQLAIVAASLQSLSQTTLPMLQGEVNHSCNMAYETIQTIRDRFQKPSMDSRPWVLPYDHEAIEAKTSSRLAVTTLGRVHQSLGHLRQTLQSMRAIIQQQQMQPQLQFRSAPVARAPTLVASPLLVDGRRLVTRTASFRAQLADWNLQFIEQSSSLENLFQQLREACRKIPSSQLVASHIVPIASAKLSRTQELAILRRQHHQVHSLRAALVGLHEHCNNEFTNWQQLHQELETKLLPKRRPAETQLRRVTSKEQNSDPRSGTGERSQALSTESQPAAITAQVEDPAALVRELIQTKLALAEQQEQEELLRRTMRRQQREFQQTVAKLGETVSRLEIKLAKKRQRSRNQQ